MNASFREFYILYLQQNISPQIDRHVFAHVLLFESTPPPTHTHILKKMKHSN